VRLLLPGGDTGLVELVAQTASWTPSSRSARPGIDTSIGGADGLNVPDGSVYAIQAYESLPAAGIGLLGSGREGAYWESFGAERLSSDHQIVDERETSVTNVHDLQTGEDSWLFNGYLDRNTTSLNNAALVNLGLGEEASRG